MNKFVINRHNIKNNPTISYNPEEIQLVHRFLPGYHPTPLISLDNLSRKLGVKSILVKDEAHRFGLKAFKVLGASYAIYDFFKTEWEADHDKSFEFNDWLAGKYSGLYTFCTATDGNHGRAVAWMAKLTGQKAQIFMPRGTVPARIENIKNEGAEVTVVDGIYDEALAYMADKAEKNGWIVISDTAYEGYTEIPKNIMAGYSTLFDEIINTAVYKEKGPPDLIILQGGMGAFAASGVLFACDQFRERMPEIVVVEPTAAACLTESAATVDGHMTTASGNSETIMAGLNCATPSPLPWPILRDNIDLFLALDDEWAVKAMRRYYYPEKEDTRIISGESGAASLAALLALIEDDNLIPAREYLHINNESKVLLINTEGDTDPEGFKKVIG